MIVRKDINESITIDLDGPDGDAFSIMGIVNFILKKSSVKDYKIEIIMNDMMSGDYNHLIKIADEVVGSIVTFETQNDELLNILSK